jgi:hypothetical protein
VEILNYHKCGSPYRVHIDMALIYSAKDKKVIGYSAVETKLA